MTEGSVARYHRDPEALERRLGREYVLLLPNGDATVLEGGAAAVWAVIGSDSVEIGEICSRLFAGSWGREERGAVSDMVETLARHGALRRR